MIVSLLRNADGLIYVYVDNNFFGVFKTKAEADAALMPF